MSDPVILCKMEVVYMPIFRLPQTTFKPTKVCIPLSHHNHHHHGHGHSNLTDDELIKDVETLIQTSLKMLLMKSKNQVIDQA